MSAPKLVWEPDLAAELAAEGANLHIVGMGKVDPADDEVIGWYVFLKQPSGEHKLLMMQVKYRPKVYKTYAGLRALIRESAPDWPTVTVPVIPQVRSEDELWTMLDTLNAEKKPN